MGSILLKWLWQVSSSDGDVLRLLYVQRLPLDREVVHGDELLRPLHHVLLLCSQSHEVNILVVKFSECPEFASYDAYAAFDDAYSFYGDAHDASDDSHEAYDDAYNTSDD